MSAIQLFCISGFLEFIFIPLAIFSDMAWMEIKKGDKRMPLLIRKIAWSIAVLDFAVWVFSVSWIILTAHSWLPK